MKKNAHPFARRIVLGALLLAVSGAAFADTVVVRPGDTLIIIAERELGDRNRFREICELNIRVLRHDCNYLVVGTVLELPERGEARKVAVKKQSPRVEASKTESTPKPDYMARFGRSSNTRWSAPDGYWAIPRFNYTELSGYVENAPFWGQPGIWIRLPTSIEEKASGKTVQVSALVRTRRTPGPISLAYSTGEVGASGWIEKTAGTQFRPVSFTYKVPPMKEGRGDFIGILPDPKGLGQVLRVSEISVRILTE